MRILRNDIGIDLGTANMLVYVRGKGIVLNEPSVVAVNQKTGQVVAVGTEAKNMIGRTPPHIVAVRPIVDGVISDFEVTEEMLHYLLNKAQTVSKKILGPRVVVGVPSGITNVETRAVRDATKNAGASEVHIIEEPMAAAIGMHLPIEEPLGNMVIDIGGGTADIAVISLGGVVSSKNIRIAGDKLNNDIASYIRSEFKIVIGDKTAEDIKISICSLLPEENLIETQARGRDLITGLPREVAVTDSDVRDAVSHSIERLVEATKEVLEITPPEILSDIMHRGIHLAGGGALMKGFAKVLEREIKMPVYIADDPLTCVVRGTGIILEKLGQFKDILIADENDISNKTH
ncbi:MAG: rod shape-determining protein [Candidatus Zambryskibacteria bacterium]